MIEIRENKLIGYNVCPYCEEINKTTAFPVHYSYCNYGALSVYEKGGKQLQDTPLNKKQKKTFKMLIKEGARKPHPLENATNVVLWKDKFLVINKDGTYDTL